VPKIKVNEYNYHMQVKQIINPLSESISRAPDADFPGGVASMHRDPLVNKVVAAPGAPGYHMGIDSRSNPGHPNLYMFKSAESREPVAQMELRKVQLGPLRGFAVDSITTSEYHRGKGLAHAMYIFALRSIKITLFSDKSQTTGGRQNWMNLASAPGVQVRGWVQLPDRLIDGKQGNILVDSLMNLGGGFLGSSNDTTGINHWFEFNVKAGTGELSPEVNTALKLYVSENTHASYEFITGLYAKWIA
jgi:hypothetical protein